MGVGEGVGVRVAVGGGGAGVGVAVGAGVMPATGTSVAVAVGTGSGVAVGVGDGDGVFVDVGVSVGAGVDAGTVVAVGVGVAVAVAVGVSVGGGVGVSVASGSGVGVAVGSRRAGRRGGGSRVRLATRGRQQQYNRSYGAKRQYGPHAMDLLLSTLSFPRGQRLPRTSVVDEALFVTSGGRTGGRGSCAGRRLTRAHHGDRRRHGGMDCAEIGEAPPSGRTYY